MKTLPNGVAIFNSTPHAITFWRDDWVEPVSVEPDELINAEPVEELAYEESGVKYVRTIFKRSEDGWAIVERMAHDHPNVVIVGSIIAAQAYAGSVVSMVPHPNYGRVPPAEKRMLPDKFNVF